MANPAVDFVLQFFECDHLPPELRVVAQSFKTLAHQVAVESSNQETTVSLRKLLEAKDAAVRAVLVERRRAG